MAKLKYPPQAGEKRLCLTLFCTMMLSVISCVGIIYAIVIIYIPSIEVLQADFVGPKMCTTIEKQGNLTDCGTGEEKWSSCEEWCLSTHKTCHHLYAAVRELGTTIYWDGCDFEEVNDSVFIDHTCNTLEDEEDLNCKVSTTETDKDGNRGHKETCTAFNDVIISCEAGICKNVSNVYDCTFKSTLDDIENANNGRGVCHCSKCGEKHGTSSSYINSTTKVQKYEGTCHEMVDICYSGERTNWNRTMKAACEVERCYQCRDICHFDGKCFDLNTRKDPTKIGTDKYELPVLTYYVCYNGYCSEIYDLKCQRRCDSRNFETKDKNSILFIGERVIMATCMKRHTELNSGLETENFGRKDTIMVACTNITLDRDSSNVINMISEDCVNGTWFYGEFNKGSTNYSLLTNSYNETRDLAERSVQGIAYEKDLIIYPKTRIKINIEGCVNTLSMECMAFYRNYGGDGRNHTSRAVYQCYYDPNNDTFAIINFDPELTLFILIVFIAVPFGIMILSCGYMCICSKFIKVSDDGHMRLFCCGKAVTGIGNVPKYDPPPRRLLKEED